MEMPTGGNYAEFYYLCGHNPVYEEGRYKVLPSISEWLLCLVFFFPFLLFLENAGGVTE